MIDNPSALPRAKLASASRLAEMLDCHRNTVYARLQSADITPVRKDGNSPKYCIRDAAWAILIADVNPGLDDMSPQDRRAWYQSESERLRVERDIGQLVPATEMAREVSTLVKALMNNLESLPDELERDCGLNTEALELVQQKVDGIRERMYIEASQ